MFCFCEKPCVLFLHPERELHPEKLVKRRSIRQLRYIYTKLRFLSVGSNRFETLELILHSCSSGITEFIRCSRKLGITVFLFNLQDVRERWNQSNNIFMLATFLCKYVNIFHKRSACLCPSFDMVS